MKWNLLAGQFITALFALASTPAAWAQTGPVPTQPTNPVNSNPTSGPTTSAPAWGANSGRNYSREFRDWHAREVKKGFELGVCVGQALATANPPVILSQQTQSLDQSMVNAVLAAVQACRNPNPTTTQNPPVNQAPVTNPPVPAPPTTASPAPSPSPAPGMVSNQYLQQGHRMKYRRQQQQQGVELN